MGRYTAAAGMRLGSDAPVRREGSSTFPDSLPEQIFVSVLSNSEMRRASLAQMLGANGFSVETDALTQGAPRVARNGRAEHVILIDSLADAFGLASVADIHMREPDARIALLSDHCEPAELQNAFAAGVDAVILWSVKPGALVLMIPLLAGGEKFIPSPLVGSLAAMLGTRGGQSMVASHAGLSTQQLDILRCLADGASNKVIANRLSIGVATVRVQVRTILRKLNILNRTQAAIWATRNVAIAGLATSLLS